MAAPCGGDPLVCIEFVILGIGEFLKDWTTMGMLAILLGLLLRYRADRAKAREDAYGRQLADFDTRRSQAAQSGGGSGRIVSRGLDPPRRGPWSARIVLRFLPCAYRLG